MAGKMGCILRFLSAILLICFAWGVGILGFVVVLGAGEWVCSNAEMPDFFFSAKAGSEIAQTSGFHDLSDKPAQR